MTPGSIALHESLWVYPIVGVRSRSRLVPLSRTDCDAGSATEWVWTLRGWPRVSRGSATRLRPWTTAGFGAVDGCLRITAVLRPSRVKDYREYFRFA